MNFDVVKELVAYGRELEKTHDKHFRFTLTTNGVLLNDDDVIEFANKKKWITSFLVSTEEKSHTIICARSKTEPEVMTLLLINSKKSSRKRETSRNIMSVEHLPITIWTL